MLNNPVLSRGQAFRNVVFYSADMVLFGLAISFMDASTVVPNFVGQATHSEILIGFSGVLFALFWRFPQLLVAPAIGRSTRKRRWMLLSSIPGRLSLIGVGLAVALIGGTNPGLILVIFFVGYALLAVGDGITMNAWVGLIGAAVPHRTRGIMFGVTQVVSGLLILAAQPFLQHLLSADGPPYPQNFAVIFVIAGVLFGATLPFIANFYEAPMPPSQSEFQLSQLLPYLRRLVREDAGFRQYLIMRFVQDSSLIAMPFFIGYETQVLGVPSAQAVSGSLIAVMVGSLTGSVLGSWLGSRFNSRTVILLQAVALLVGPIAALLGGSLGGGALLVTFMMTGLVSATYTTGAFNWLVAYAPVHDRGLYSSISNTLGIAALAVPLAGGLLLQLTSYNVLFVAAIGISLVAGALALNLKVAPSGDLSE